MSGTLYIIATPIGNLGDIGIRAINILRDVDYVLAEDTRVTNKLLMKYDITKVIKRYDQRTKEDRKLRILNDLLGGGEIALVSDAGTPGISDPGNELIDFLISRNNEIRVIPIPGPSAAISALSVSGFNVSNYIFLGFFPKKKRKRILELVNSSKIAVVFYESPHRILKTLKYLEEELLESRRVMIARELTKLHETIYRGTIAEVKTQLGKGKVKGELVVVIERK